MTVKMDGITVRPYEQDDADGLWTLKQSFELELGQKDEEKGERYEAKLTEEYRRGYLSWVADCIERDDGCLIVAEDDELIGYAFVLPESLSFIWDAAVLNELYLSSEYRGTDAATMLITAALDHAREQTLPLDRMLLDVDPANERARAFYETFGFEPWAEMIGREL
ncbi:N-acetyltransferase family protein [Halocatena marina]|uniref:N-acetyltransferase family protein n=1 Tax=Halocatena marina TaxID=2934937 RepID=A0ABD5YQZ0_9EURY